jgi:Tol biopolymer transport system component
MKKTIACALWLFVSAVFYAAPDNPSWLRYPAISPDGKTIVFTYKGDLYRVPSSGGTATQLTTHTAHDFMPVWSHDGKSIAFASDRYGNFDVFVMPAEGGEARRVTFHSAQEYPYTFTNDDKSFLLPERRERLVQRAQDERGRGQVPTDYDL